MTREKLVEILNRLYPSTRWPKPFNLFQGLLLLESGEPLNSAARQVGTVANQLRKFSDSSQFVSSILHEHPPNDSHRRSTRQIIGNLIVGKCAEISFEEIYKEHTHTTELELRNLTEARSDTDYRLLNGKGRPVYRVNIKYHGSLFRRAREMVGLEPNDCFALATYKIHGALQKQTDDQLPYIFVVVSVPGLTAESIGEQVPTDFREFVAFVTANRGIPRKRDIEDRVVQHLRQDGHPSFDATRKRIRQANWYVLGARRADNMLRNLLFERVFALRTRNFSRQFRGAELDMHFSLSSDMTALSKYLETLRESGYPRVTTLLERGDF